ncbi:MAG TPA: UDP-N-acetylmuramate dehydrogenase [Actinomycetota bacterium]|nr:UDP-N-acetylmuramate dehydrogenase [Actinomycetota bacterium]
MPELADAERLLRDRLGAQLRVGFPLAPLTSFRIGGPAALFVEADDDGALEAVGRAVSQTGVPVMVIGKGSNVLVSDEGFPGVVVRLGRGYRWAGRDGARLTAGGAMPLPALAGVAMRHRLAGLEFGVAIPASLGGAVKMNAGAHGRSMSEVIERIDIYSLSRGARLSFSADEAGFAYRRSSLPSGGIVVGAVARLEIGEEEHIRAHMEEARDWRRRTQPLAEPNCGSVFKNPDGDHAARLIEEAGGKGLRLGGAQVSPKHSNFIVADPGASASDVWQLIERVRALVEAHAGIRLETEVELMGAVGDAQR